MKYFGRDYAALPIFRPKRKKVWMVRFLSKRVRNKIHPALVLRPFFFLLTPFANLHRLICALSFSVFAPCGWLRFITLIPYLWWECHFLCTFTLSVTQLGRDYNFAFSLVWVLWNLVCKVMIDCIMGSFIIYTFCQIFLGWSHQERRDSRACGTKRRGTYGVLVVEEPEGNTTWKT
jgi:hypothetical protein